MTYPPNPRPTLAQLVEVAIEALCLDMLEARFQVQNPSRRVNGSFEHLWRYTVPLKITGRNDTATSRS